MKKNISILFIILMLAGILSGCGSSLSDSDKNISIVTTIFPEYDWVMNILGDKASDADVTMLLDNGVDLHSFQPTADDIIKISKCDLFIYVGGESDKWVEDTLKEATNKDMVAINLLDVLGDSVKEEEIKEGMETDEDEQEGGEDIEYDEHVWLSVRNAAVLVDSISDALGKLDTDNAAVYSSNASEYIKKLNDLDNRYQNAVDNAKVRTILFGDRFPFRYLTDDYGLDYYAAFVGCSAESEASFETIRFLADKVDELELSTVLTLEGTDHRIAETIVSTSKSKSARILSMDSMQSATSKDVASGATYLSIMEKNLDVLKSALK
ncbi:MAG: metal ABC transporter substrate-binding protein [Lachnospiraceae bacterium]|nr:metal ABC transporter substrate-binding protein [Lachnospiraceae bacterium]